MWSEVTVSYTIEIKLHSESDGNLNLAIVHEENKLEDTEYTYSDFTNGRTYSWSVYAQDSKGYDSVASPLRELNIDTTKFLADKAVNGSYTQQAGLMKLVLRTICPLNSMNSGGFIPTMTNLTKSWFIRTTREFGEVE